MKETRSSFIITEWVKIQNVKNEYFPKFHSFLLIKYERQKRQSVLINKPHYKKQNRLAQMFPLSDVLQFKQSKKVQWSSVEKMWQNFEWVNFLSSPREEQFFYS